MRVVRRGKFSTLVDKQGDAIEARLYKCIVQRAPHVSGGKTYATLDLACARGAGIGVLRSVATRIDREAAPAFSPLMGDRVVVKLPAGGGVKYETREGAADAPFELVVGQAVDVVLRLGAFGGFGYCWLVSRVKPHEPEAADILELEAAEK